MMGSRRRSSVLVEVSETEDALEDEADSDDEEGPAQEYDRCQRCTRRMDVLQTAVRTKQNARSEMDNWEERVVRSEQQMQNHRVVLAQAYQNLPAATHFRQVMEQEWIPQQQHCEQVFVSSANARNAHMMVCHSIITISHAKKPVLKSSAMAIMVVGSLKDLRMVMHSPKAVWKSLVLLPQRHGSCRHPIMVGLLVRTVESSVAASWQSSLPVQQRQS